MPSFETATSAALRPGADELVRRAPALALQMGEGVLQRERDHVLPFDAFALFRASGLGALRIPRAAGGPGGALEDLFSVLITLAAADSNVAHALRLHYDFSEFLALSPPSAFNAVQVRRILQGALFGGASAERDTAKPGEIRTTLVRAGEAFKVSGRKYYATGTAFCDYARINLRDESGGHVIAIVPVDRAGVGILDDWDGMGQQLTASGTLALDDVDVFDSEVAPLVFDTLAGRHGSALRQLHLVAVAAGIVRNVLADAENYVRRHSRAAGHSSAATAAQDPFIQQAVGEIAAASHAIDALVLDTARVLDRGARAIANEQSDADDRVLDGALATAKAQLVVGSLAMRAAERLFDTGGASATSRARGFDRHWRNLRTLFSHNPLAHKARAVGDYHLNGEATHLKAGRVF